MKLHEKIKKVREELGITIQEVYDRQVEIFGSKKATSYRTLLRIEQGHIAKFSSVLKICCALGITLEELLKETEQESKLVIRKKERLDEYTYNDKVSASVVSAPNRSFLALELNLEPSGKTSTEQSPRDKGTFEKWVYVLEGELTCVVGKEKFKLSGKDTISFDSCLPHHFENNSKKRSLCIVFQNPKYF